MASTGGEKAMMFCMAAACLAVIGLIVWTSIQQSQIIHLKHKVADEPIIASSGRANVARVAGVANSIDAARSAQGQAGAAVQEAADKVPQGGSQLLERLAQIRKAKNQ